MSELAITHVDGAQRMGFFTDTTVCIGCKACQVACHQWNDLPAQHGPGRRPLPVAAMSTRLRSPLPAVGAGASGRAAGMSGRCGRLSVSTKRTWRQVLADSACVLS